MRRARGASDRAQLAGEAAPAPGTAPGTAGRRRPLLIGLTGPIGCGKSTIAGWLTAAGGRRIDADALARAVTEPGEPAVAAIRARFGPGVVGAGDVLDRAALARVVFADPAALADLEAIVHPAVRIRILAALETAERDGVPYVVIEAIKLVEGGLAALCDEVWLVECTVGAQRSRLAGRGVPPDDVESRLAAQGADLADRLRPAATRVVRTDGPIEDDRAHVLRLLDEARSG